MAYLQRSSLWLAILLTGSAVGGCELVVDFDRSLIGDGGMDMESGTVDAMADARPDVMPDAADDAAVDAPVDAPADAPPLDAPPVDAPVDAPMDAPVDAPGDAAADAPIDAPMDGSADGGTDAATDAGADGGVDAGECAGNQDCDDTNPCTMDVCDAGTCMNMAIAGCCTSGADCSGATPLCDTSSMQCVECLDVSDCDDGDACTTDSCSGSGVCMNAAITDCCTEDMDCGGATPACDTGTNTCVECVGDGDCGAGTPVCDTGTNTCVGCLGDGDCGAGTPVCDTGTNTCVECLNDTDCDDANQCTVDTCVSNACDFDASAMESMSCDDGNFCNVGETCTSGMCQGGTSNDCNDEDSCTVDSCDEAMSMCVNQPVGDVLAAVGFQTGTSSADQVRFRNETTRSISLSGFHTCDDASACEPMAVSVPAGGAVTVTLSMVDVGSLLGQLALASASDGSAVCDYVEWGMGGQSLEDEAVMAGQWTAGDFVNMTLFSDNGICAADATDNSTSAAWSHCTF